jgi:prepilin-type N-terminal cleavage/methylation domain-containing protein
MNKLIKQAFTLIELLVVIAIIGILSGLIVVSMSGVTQKANIAKSQVFSNSLRNSLMIDMISEWKLDGGTVGVGAVAGDILDTWSTNNAVSLTGAPIIKGGSDCVSGNCIQFDGSDDSLDFGNKAAFSMGNGDHTVSFWTKIENATSVDYELFIGCSTTGSTSAGYWIFRGAAGSTALSIFFNNGVSGNSANLSDAGTFVPGSWYYVVVTMDRDNLIKAYLNGKQTNNTFNISAYQGNLQNAITLRVGGMSSTSYRTKGRMDEIRLFNSIPTASQIKEQYYVGLNSLLSNGGITKEDYLSRINQSASNE